MLRFSLAARPVLSNRIAVAVKPPSKSSRLKPLDGL
jgi:hypothetical protein